jgi:hypothetical protein
LFSGICDFALVLAIYRLREVLESYLQKIREFHEPNYASGRPVKPKLGKFGSYGMVGIYASLMLIGTSFSFIGAFFFYWPFSFCNWIGFICLLISLVAFLYVVNIETKSGATAHLKK